MLHSRRTLLVAFAALVATSCLACSSGTAATSCPADTVTDGVALLGADCDPLVPTQCGYPFPSNVWLKDDATTHTGKRVAFGATTLPIRTGGTHVDPVAFNDHDGFSAGQPLLTHLPGATLTGLPTQDDIGKSITDASPTLVIDADTGDRVPHFAELDMSVYTEDDAERALMIRPVVRLKDAHRYIVAIRRVVGVDGKPIPPTPVFLALRDGGNAPCDVSVPRRRALYDDIFTRLDKAKIPKTDLQLAWDFTTASRENNTEKLLHMRDQALATVGTQGPAYTIDKVEENPNPHIRRRIHGTMKVPLYLDKPGPGGKLVLDDKGLPKQNGTADYGFLVHVPNAATHGTAAAIVQNGHGLLGVKEEGQDDYLAVIADAENYVALAVDWIGLQHPDEATLIDGFVRDFASFDAAVDRQQQGLLNSLLAMRMMKGGFVTDPNVQFGGKSVIDPTQSFYRGDSQGGIFGATYMALSTDVTRGLLSVAGAPYSILLNRSTDFSGYFTLLRFTYVSGRNMQMMIGLMQMAWDRSEPDGYAAYITHDLLPNTPQHEVLLHAAIGDHQVTTLGAHWLARTLPAQNLKPVNRTIWGIDEVTGPLTTATMVEFDFAQPPVPTTNTPPNMGDDPHGKVRVLPAAYMQADHFFRTGEIKPFCMGACNPE